METFGLVSKSGVRKYFLLKKSKSVDIYSE